MRISRRRVRSDLFTNRIGRPTWGSPDFEAEDNGFLQIYRNRSSRISKPTTSGLNVGFYDRGSCRCTEKTRLAFLRSDLRIAPANFTFLARAKQASYASITSTTSLRHEWDLGEVKERHLQRRRRRRRADVDRLSRPASTNRRNGRCLHDDPWRPAQRDHHRFPLSLERSPVRVARAMSSPFRIFMAPRGFGQKFTDSITGDMATKPLIDVMKATDYMEALPFIDKTARPRPGAVTAAS